MNPSNIQTFDFAPGLPLRSVSINSAPWFIAADVCKALSTSNPSQAVLILDEDQRGLHSIDTPGGAQQMLVIDESGLYALALRSRKAAAKEFRKWVTGTVLPSLRKDGLYIAGQEKPITDDLTLSELLAQIAAIQEKVDALNNERVRAWSRHQEEKDARREAFRWLKGKAPRVRPVVTSLSIPVKV